MNVVLNWCWICGWWSYSEHYMVWVQSIAHYTETGGSLGNRGEPIEACGIKTRIGRHKQQIRRRIHRVLVKMQSILRKILSIGWMNHFFIKISKRFQYKLKMYFFIEFIGIFQCMITFFYISQNTRRSYGEIYK